MMFSMWFGGGVGVGRFAAGGRRNAALFDARGGPVALGGGLEPLNAQPHIATARVWLVTTWLRGHQLRSEHDNMGLTHFS